MPFYWTLPFLQQEEIRYMLLLGSIFAVFRLTLRSMVQQLDSILEKATDGLFIPISENRIVKQFMVIPITICRNIFLTFPILQAFQPVH